MLCGTRRAHASEAALLLAEPFGTFGAVNPTGHASVYLSGVCADTPTELRLCRAGEYGVVLSRYHRIAGYDWLAIPLIPYLYAVESPEEIPATADLKLERKLRDAYRREHLMALAPDDPKKEIPGGEWIQLIGASYDRRIYGFAEQTTTLQDEALIADFNGRENKSHFNLLFENCANFSEDVLNYYYPHSVHRNFIADIGLVTPKQVARSLTKYGKRHPELESKAFVIPQVPGSIPRSKSVDGVVESVVRSKKYVLPIAALHPVVAGVLVATYLGDGRFHPDLHAAVFDPSSVVHFGEGDEQAATKPEGPAQSATGTAQVIPAGAGFKEP
ncbi:hypothetical protein [Silvibacterium acidisoli]|uniref:hypothetical protein n=1 Tax=Acidobacteriaceae bacterium ZG23-2 TaxID=2883246 RepID=UPI00406CC964